jgi:hypothetical protein
VTPTSRVQVVTSCMAELGSDLEPLNLSGEIDRLHQRLSGIWRYVSEGTANLTIGPLLVWHVWRARPP